jgi:hypothetical protein
VKKASPLGEVYGDYKTFGQNIMLAVKFEFF